MLDVRTPLLVIKDLQAWYGESHILHGVTFDVNEGEVVTLLGRNGAGKTTTLKSIMGIVGHRTGSVRFQARRTDRPQFGSDCARGRRLLPRGARCLFQSQCRGKPAAASGG